MFKIKEIKLTNFLSYEEANINLDAKVTVINGKNLDDQGQYSNGSGKSAFLESIYFAFTGFSMRGVNVKQLIRRGSGSAKVEVVLINLTDSLIITRTLDVKKSQTLKVIDKNVEQVDASALDLTKWLFNYLGIDRDVLFHYLVTRDKFQPFLKTTDGQKKEILTSLSGHQLVDNAIADVKKENIALTALIQENCNLVSKEEGKIEHLEDQLNKLSVPNAENELEKVKLKEQLSNIDATYLQKNKYMEVILIDKEKEKNEFIAQLKEAEKNHEIVQTQYDIKIIESQVQESPEELEKLKADKVELLEIYKLFKDSKNELEKESLIKENQLIVLNRQLIDSVECPKCKNTILIGSNLSKEELNYQIESLKANLLSVKQQIDKLVEKIEKIVNLGTEVKNKLNQVESNWLKVVSEKKQAELRLSSSLRESQRKINQIRSQKDAVVGVIEQNNLSLRKLKEIQDLEKLNIERNIQKNESYEEKRVEDFSKTKESLALVKKNVKLIDKEVKKLQKQNTDKLKVIDQLKSFKSWLSVRTLSTIERLSNRQLELMDSSLQLKLEGFRETSSGEIKDQIDCFITRDGLDYFTYGSLSAGEKARMDLATMLAIQQLTGLTTKSKLNFLTIDEVLDAVDQIGIQEILISLSKLPQQFLVVSQHEPMVSNCSSITAVKENGKTIIVNN